MAIILNGYRSKTNLNANQMLKIMEKIKKSIQSKWHACYVDLISDEVNIVADYYVLKNLNINKNASILDVATERVCNRIVGSIQADVFTRYNYRVCIEVMPFGGKWYYLCVCNNPLLRKDLLSEIPELESYNVYQSEVSTEAEKIWSKLQKEYTEVNIPMRLNFVPSLPMEIDAAELKLQDRKERAYYHAVSDERNAILSSLSLNQAIPPQEVIRYIDEIDMERDLSEEHEAHIQDRTSQLSLILPDLTVDLVTSKLGLSKPTDEPTPDNSPTTQDEA